MSSAKGIETVVEVPELFVNVNWRVESEMSRVGSDG